MIPCPSCHKPVEILDKHVGTLFTCPFCNAVYFIDFSGQPEMANHEDSAEAESIPSVESETSSSQDYTAPQDFNSETQFSGAQTFENSESAYANENIEQPADVYSSEQNYDSQNQGYVNSYEDSSANNSENNYAAPPEPAYGEPEAAADAIEDDSFDFNKTLDQVPAQTPPPVSVSDSSDFSDVTDFANADTAVGPMSYVVTIDGIESSHLLYQLKEAMTDSRFGWDLQELMTTVGGGRLILPGLTPAKASVLINRIKYLPFKISWRQDVLSGS